MGNSEFRSKTKPFYPVRESRPLTLDDSLERRNSSRALTLVLLACGILFFVCGIGAVLLTDNPVSEFAQQKYTSLRYRLLEYFPQPGHDQLLPTPLARLGAADHSPDATPTPNSAITTPVATRIAKPDATGTSTPTPTSTSTRIPTLAANVKPIQPTVALTGFHHDWQRFNNCGPTTLEMYLSFYGKKDSQTDIANFTKPNPEDKNVRPDELAAYANQSGMQTSIRMNGTLDELKLFLSNGIPIMVETAFVKEPQGWMGHYRLLVGYDDTQFNTMDSYDGPNVKISFSDLDKEWHAFNNVYFVVYRQDQDAVVRAIIGDATDDQVMYTNAVKRARDYIAADGKDAFAYFNLGTSLNGLQRYGEAAAAFDQARVIGLPWRMLWYQFGPYEAYLQAGRDDEVIALADAMIKTSDDLEESHYYKGLALRALGKRDEARSEFETALRYNKNYRDAQLAFQATSN